MISHDEEGGDGEGGDEDSSDDHAHGDTYSETNSKSSDRTSSLYSFYSSDETDSSSVEGFTG